MDDTKTEDVERTVARLRAMVQAAKQEADLAVAYREAWRPMAHDAALHARMGQSFASQTFLTIRVGLWRETIAALMRIWDNSPDSINLGWVMRRIGDDKIVAKLHEHHFNDQTIFKEEIIASVKLTVAQITAAHKMYATGEKRADLIFLRRLRHEQLAHSQSKSLTAPPADWCDDRTEGFYEATIGIVGKLLSVAEATHYNLKDTAEVYGFHANLFWAGVKGERTEGHPNYRPPI